MITLVLGGAASGKSLVAERMAGALPPPVTYVATWIAGGDDPDMSARIAAHRARRPAHWALVEVGTELPAALREVKGTVLVDALGTWVGGAADFAPDARGLCEALRARTGDTVVVSDEVGMAVHPVSEAGRRFRDALGAVNQAVAAVADDAWLVVAGRLLRLESV